MGGFIVFLATLRVEGPPIWRVVAMPVALAIVIVIVPWVLACFDSHRAPDYDWGDWKLRKE